MICGVHWPIAKAEVMSVKEIEHLLLLLRRQPLSPDCVRLDFAAPSLAAEAQAGQFLEISCPGFLNRPFGIMDASADKGEVSIGVKMVGSNSRWLADQHEGVELKALGPLGHGFDLKNCKRLLAVGGGSGIFPLFFAVRRALETGARVQWICGFRDEAQAFPHESFAGLPAELFFSSDQGGLDFHGHAGAALEALTRGETFDQSSLLIACGPLPLLRFARDFARTRQLSAQLSLEERMACGLGLCLGCAVDLRDEKQGLKRLRCCKEGPVFSAEELVFPGDPQPLLGA